MKKIQLGVIFGGNSSEYPVSLHSVGSVLHHIDKDRYEITLIGITQDGIWYYYNGDIDTLEHDKWLQHGTTRRAALSPSQKEGLFVFEEDGSFKTITLDCVLPVLHGKNGEDGTLQGLLEMAQIPYVGCNHVSSAIAMDKEYTHIICEASGIQMAPYLSITNRDVIDYQSLQQEVQTKLTLPLFVKPANAGSSFGISKVDDIHDLEKAVKFALEYDDKVVVENGIDGFEVGCAVLGNHELTIGEPDEIDTHNNFFDYEAKYELVNTEIVCPARVDEKITNEIKENAKHIYKILGCKGLARVDMFVSTDQQIYFNEINTIPGFTSASRYPTMMKAVGIDFTTLINKLIDLAME
ncbi:D-alanine--D-alanine ligase [Breznakia sp. OttesenSCG-928-G09]|nr:D-alanine--D-alanine ligase [Breznakia sp. OttesenSCG-928-G09]